MVIIYRWVLVIIIYTQIQMGSSDASPYNHQKKSTLQISTNTSKFFLNLLMEIIIHGDKEADNKDLCLRNAFKQRRMHNDLSLRVSLISQIQIQNRKEWRKQPSPTTQKLTLHTWINPKLTDLSNIYIWVKRDPHTHPTQDKRDRKRGAYLCWESRRSKA